MYIISCQKTAIMDDEQSLDKVNNWKNVLQTPVYIPHAIERHLEFRHER